MLATLVINPKGCRRRCQGSLPSGVAWGDGSLDGSLDAGWLVGWVQAGCRLAGWLGMGMGNLV